MPTPNTTWTSSGGDLANRRQWQGGLRTDQEPGFRPLLDLPQTNESRSAGGGVVLSDGSLVVLHAHEVMRFRHGALLWQRALADLLADGWTESDSASHSAPTVLCDDSIFFTTGSHGVVIGSDGEILESVSGDMRFDDSGPSPAVLASGSRILTSPMDEVRLWTADGLVEVGTFGFDVVPPAVCPDDSFVVSGYYGSGLTRLYEDGTILWTDVYPQVDLSATVSSAFEIGVGCLNEGNSKVFDADGNELFTYDEAGVLGEHPSGDWLILSEESIARVERDGRVRWRQRTSADRGWGSNGPVSSADGSVLVLEKSTLRLFDADGKEMFRFSLPAPSSTFFPAGPDSIGVIVKGQLLVLK